MKFECKEAPGSFSWY